MALLGSLGTGLLSAADWESGDGFRSRPLEAAVGTGSAGFTAMDSALTGLYFTNHLARSRYMTNQIYLNGSGVTAGDTDGDGRVDVFFSGLDGRNRLYRNLGDWRFEDVTQEAGVGAEGLASSGCALVDIDGDADLDLLVNTIGQGTHLFTNDGKGRYTWQTRRRAPNAGKGGMSMALADVEGDGDLDLYLANYRTWTYRDHPRPKIRGNMVNGKPVVVSFNGRPTTDPDLVGRFTLNAQNKIIENGELDAFFLNDGRGRFRQVPLNGGTFLDTEGRPWKEPAFEWGLSVMFRDMNGDLAPDLYVCNDFSAPDRIWLNQGDGTFQLMPALALRNTSRFAMGIDFADLDRDGHDDFVVMDMLSRDHERRHIQMGEPPLGREVGDDLTRRPQFSRNTLYRNRGDNTYAEVAYWAGTHAAEWAWTPAFLDVDLDGFEDLLVTNGHERDALNADVKTQIEAQVRDPKLTRQAILMLSAMFARLDTPNVAFRNRGDFTFEDVSDAWGFAVSAVSHGMALADLDNDGDQDVLVNNLGSPAGVFRNNGKKSRVAVRLRGVAPNTAGVGAKIRFLGQPRDQSQEMVCGGRYLSSDDLMRTFACAADETDAVIEVEWRSGRISRVTGIRANHLYEIHEDAAVAQPPSAVPSAVPLFEAVDSILPHRHRETPFDDFFRQRLLSRSLSELGPGVSWVDLDQDGFDDLLVGAGRGGQMGVLLNQDGRSFKASSDRRLNPIQSRDQTGIVTWVVENASGDAVTRMGYGASNYEDARASGAAVVFNQYEGNAGLKSLPAGSSSAGPLAMADVDADGDLDLFVGGRVVPGQYPNAADSQLWIQEADGFRASPVNGTPLMRLGLVSGAVWTDLNGDGYPELVVACEWGPVRVLANRQGRLQEATAAWGLSEYTGWWNGVAAGDFDGDGRMDLVASNWGQNHSYQPFGASNLRWVSGQAVANGPRLLVEGYVDESHEQPVPIRNFRAFAGTIPSLGERYRTHSQFAKATVSAIVGQKWRNVTNHRVATFAHTVFLNRGDYFEATPLPWLSQLAPGFALCVADVDMDGHEDLFLSQNLFAVRPGQSRLDSGRGQLMLGDGEGGFRAIDGAASGIRVYGEQRGAAFGDYDNDGRVDLVVTQNGADTRLFHGLSQRRGLRIRLHAGEQNQTGIGARVQLGQSGRWGAAREVRGGSGYWSQGSAVQIMSRQARPKQVKVQWPGGKEEVWDLPSGADEIMVTQSEGVEKVSRP